MRNTLLSLILLVFNLPASAQAPMIEAHRPKLINPQDNLHTQTDDLGITLTVCLLIICVYFLYWLKQRHNYYSAGRNHSKSAADLIEQVVNGRPN